MKTIEVCYTPNNILNYKLSNKIIVVIDNLSEAISDELDNGILIDPAGIK